MQMLRQFVGCRTGWFAVASYVAITACAAETVTPAGKTPAAEKFRKLAPGVERVVQPEFKLDGTGNRVVARHDLLEIVNADPTYGERANTPGVAPAKNVRFEQTVQAVRFGFKPLRMIAVDVPTPDEVMESQLVWYLVFHITNPSADEAYKLVPRFWIEDLDKKTVFPATLVPTAMNPIRRREDPNRALADIISVAGSLEPGQDVWGVATWNNVDPSIKQIAVYVQGLSTAYEWEQTTDARTYRQQTLQLHFWRPADEFHEHEDEIRFGLPGEVDYRWLYR